MDILLFSWPLGQHALENWYPIGARLLVARSSPNCPKSDKVWSHSKVARPARFSYSTTRSGAKSAAGSGAASSC
jgi:hypothetical protein